MFCLGAIEASHSVVVDFRYLTTMEMRQQVEPRFLNQAEKSFYELLLPVCFKPKYSSNPTGDKIFVTGAEAKSIKCLKKSDEEKPITVELEVVSSYELEIYDRSSSARNSQKLQCYNQGFGGRFLYTYYPNPASMGDIFLGIANTNYSLSTANSNEAKVVDSEKAEAQLFKFSDVLKSDSPLYKYNKYGLIVDYAIKRKPMYEVILF